MKKYLMCGEGREYVSNLNRKIFPFTTSRLAPFLGFTLIIISISRFNYPELSNFSYLTALYSLPVVLLSMPLAMIGNIVVSQKRDNKSGKEIFLSGLLLCLLLSVTGFIVSLVLQFFVLKKSDNNIILASDIYVFCVPLLIANTYLFFFIESFISNRIMAQIKLYTTLLCATGTVSIALTVPVLLTWHVFTIFLVFECALFICYLFVILHHFKNSSEEKLKLNPVNDSIKIMKLGFPVALGLAGQKLVYFLITMRLLGINKEYISHLSVFLSVLGFLSLPVGAFTQIHSLYMSSVHASRNIKIFGRGVIFLMMMCTCITIILYPLIPYIIEVFGTTASNVLNQHGMYFSLFSYFFSTSLMLLCMSHLRALNDTFIPQCTANFVLLVIFIPFIWLRVFDRSDLSTFLNLQSVFLLIVSFMLAFRIKGKEFSPGVEKVLHDRC